MEPGLGRAALPPRQVTSLHFYVRDKTCLVEANMLTNTGGLSELGPPASALDCR